MDNTYPGIGQEVSDSYNANLIAEMLYPQSGSNQNRLTDAMVWPAGAIYRTFAHTWGSDAIIMGGVLLPRITQQQLLVLAIFIKFPQIPVAQENMTVPVGASVSIPHREYLEIYYSFRFWCFCTRG